MIEELLIPVIVVVLMVAAGTGVRASQFSMVLRAPVVLFGGTIAQVEFPGQGSPRASSGARLARSTKYRIER